MIAPSHPTPPFRIVYATLLAVCLLGSGGCAQMQFPELPTGLFAQPKAKSAEQPTGADTAAEAAEPPTTDTAAAAEEPTEPGKLFEWDGNGRKLTRIVIDTNAQTAHFYAGKERVGWTTIASGVASHPTPRGQFSILEKARDKRSNLYGKIVGGNGRVIRSSADGNDPVPRGARFVGASMPNFMRLTYDGIGMHAGPIPHPGRPASHGCIRMPPQVAAAVYEHVGPGTAVTIVGSGPDYGNYAERVARQQAEERARRAAAAAAAKGTALDALDAEVEVMQDAGVAKGTAGNMGRQESNAARPATEPGNAAAGASSAQAPSLTQPQAQTRPSSQQEEQPRAQAPEPEQPAQPGGRGAEAEANTRADAAGAQPGAALQGQPTVPTPTPSSAPAEATPDEAGTPAEPRDYMPPAPPPTMHAAGLPAVAAGV